MTARLHDTGRHRARGQTQLLVGVLGATMLGMAVVGALMQAREPAVGPAFVVLVMAVVVAAIRPAFALGALVPLALLGDTRSMTWWPAVKYLSAQESVLYIGNGFSVSPLEIVLATILVVWLVQRAFSARPEPIVTGALWRPMLLFTAMVVFGLVWGLSRGGDLRVAQFQVRPLLVIPVLYLLFTNLFTSLRHYRAMLWGCLAALAAESTYALVRMSDIRVAFPGELSPVEHTAALHMDLAIVFLAASFLLRRGARQTRVGLVLLTAPVLILYLQAERRAGVVCLIIGLIFVFTVLFARHRRRFLTVVPPLAVLGLLYVGAFWGSESAIGFPAQAVKSVVDPELASASDASSDLYRLVENFNLGFTIESNPVLGIGFGQQFLRPVPLPDISFFEFWAYIPHNSVLWMWTQVGIVGFVAFLYLFGMATAIGARAARRMPSGADAALVASIAAYVPMTLVYAFVDITFDIQTTVLLSACFGLVASAERLAGLPPVGARGRGGECAPDDAPPRRTVAVPG